VRSCLHVEHERKGLLESGGPSVVRATITLNAHSTWRSAGGESLRHAHILHPEGKGSELHSTQMEQAS
jgi:hypothetical protein